MTSVEAAALAGSTRLCWEAYDPAADRKSLEELAVWCELFSPLVGLENSSAPDCLLLDVANLEHIFGSESSLAEKIVRDFTQRRLLVHVAVADTVGVAWAVAHFVDGASRRSQPGGFTIVPPGRNTEGLHPLPIEALRLPDKVVDLLHQLGVYRVGQCELLPRADLTSRFGPLLLKRLDQASGRLAEPIPAHPLPAELSVRQSLEHPTTRRETVEFVLEQLTGRLAALLVRAGRGAIRLDCRLECRTARSVDLSVALFQSTASARHLFELLRMRLDRASFPQPVEALKVEASVTAPFEARQQELFPEGSSVRHRRQLASLVDRLTSRLGSRAVLGTRLVCEAQPELACRYDPLVTCSPVKRSRRGDSRQASAADLPPRPLRLLEQPIPLQAVSIMPDGPPLQFRLHGSEHRISHSWGPERIETGWWRGRPIRRDYYRIETTTGRRYWLFRRLADGKWFLHGTFD